MDTNQFVLTTDELAQAFGATRKVLTNNFQRHKEDFIEETHYYLLEGEELKQFLSIKFADLSQRPTNVADLPERSTDFADLSQRSANKIRNLYLWTVKGAFVHAWILKSPQAQQAYERIVDKAMQKQAQQIAQLAQQNLALIEEKSSLTKVMVQQLAEDIHKGSDILNPGNRLIQEVDLEDWMRVYLRELNLFGDMHRAEKITSSQFRALQQQLNEGLAVLKAHLKHLEDHEPVADALWDKAYFGVQEAAKHQQATQEQLQVLQGAFHQLQQSLPPAQSVPQIEGPQQGEE